MPGKPLTFEETVLLFALLKDKPEATARDAVRMVQLETEAPHPHNWKTVWRVMLISKKLLRREQKNLPVELDASEAVELRDGSYDIKDAQIELVTSRYLKWRHEQHVESELKRSRLDRILRQMWIPEFPLIPWNLLALGDGFHGRDLRGRFLRWVQVKSNKPKKSTSRTGSRRSGRAIQACWMNEDDLLWLCGEFLVELDYQNTVGLVATFEQLHADTVSYLNRATTQAFYEAVGVAEYTLGQAQKERYHGNFPEKGRDGQQEMAYLLDEPVRLQDRLVKFQDSVRMRTEMFGTARNP